jgi:16S rRNA (guanine527-N7)-methyltransferase
LTAIRDPAEVATFHVVDSLAALKPIRARGIDSFVDLGSGGGFPGIPLAVVLPARRALLVDSIAKKIAFLETVVAAIHLEGVGAIAARAELLAAQPAHREQWSAVLARAVGGLGELVELAFPLLKPGGWLVAWKRGDLDQELEQGRRAADVLGGGDLDVVDPGVASMPHHRLVMVQKMGSTASRWPRSQAARLRSPL